MRVAAGAQAHARGCTGTRTGRRSLRWILRGAGRAAAAETCLEVRWARDVGDSRSGSCSESLCRIPSLFVALKQPPRSGDHHWPPPAP